MTTNAKKEFWLQFIASLVRKLLAIAGTSLVSHGWITSEQSAGLSSAVVVEFVVGALLIFGSSLWTWAKIKFNVHVIREARAADNNTPIAEITGDTLKKESLISSV
jgi:hypothetical protein